MTAEERYIAAHYGKEATRLIAQELGINQNRVRRIANRLGIRSRSVAMPKNRCGSCMLFSGLACIYGNEAQSDRCRVMRYRTARWPEPLTDFQIKKMQI